MGKQSSNTRGNVPITPRFRGKSYLLVIGINDYPYFTKLNNAVRDAETFYNLMIEKYQFVKSRSTLLLNEKATYHNIDHQLDRLINITTKEDEVVLFFSGHGIYHEKREMGYWLPYDAQYDNRQSYLANDTLATALKSIKAKHILIITDTCWSGTLIGNIKATSAINKLPNIPSRWIFSAGRVEVVEDGLTGTHSPLANSLLYFLTENTEANLRLSQVSPSIIDSVAANSNQIPQYEPIRNLGHKGGELFFRKKSNVPIFSTFTPPGTQTTVVPPSPSRFKTILYILLSVVIVLTSILTSIYVSNNWLSQNDDTIEDVALPDSADQSTLVVEDNQGDATEDKEEITKNEQPLPKTSIHKPSKIDSTKEGTSPPPIEKPEEFCKACSTASNNVKQLIYSVEGNTDEKKINVESNLYKICYPMEVKDRKGIILKSLILLDDSRKPIKSFNNYIVPTDYCLHFDLY